MSNHPMFNESIHLSMDGLLPKKMSHFVKSEEMVGRVGIEPAISGSGAHHPSH